MQMMMMTMILEEQAAYVKEAARSQVAITLPINLDSPTLTLLSHGKMKSDFRISNSELFGLNIE